ncbi:MmcQ/YjbR family DNA-binding protein [Tepidibacter hydrothermalis]|uniref:MmcQ/YjbR family DNA-binding protein n=1 Tax=Tepidibacter hydrothermalis TaxID=3036126 RepID=A0ABY8EIU4_9FIRM|nr:MmcQ/YjbR family DNA-binding protein [Tepidibacter hydrothermalis]WFD11834.1 MmcQ/YjbR family DNA-binding protein [Tepidibacter hydrothermalis]
MDLQKVRKYFLSKPHTVEDIPFRIPVPVFKVADKMFGLINIHEPDRESINLKYPKDKIYDLRSAFDEIQPGYHMNKDNWNTVYLDGQLDEDFIFELIDISYDLVFKSLTKKKQKEMSEIVVKSL